MKITLLAEDRVRFDPVPGPITVEAPSAEMQYSPFHMMASGLATCVYSTLRSWAEHAKLDADGLAIEVGWSFAEDPHRVGRFDLLLEWPGLPEARRNAAVRAAGFCPVHQTLHHPTEVHTEVATDRAP